MPIGRSVTGFTVGRRKGSLFFCGAKCRDWHFAAFSATHYFVAYWTNSGQREAESLNG
jgi:hypothetical protein